MITGFENALAKLFLAQLRGLDPDTFPSMTFVLVNICLAIKYVLLYLTTNISSPFVNIMLLTSCYVAF